MAPKKRVSCGAPGISADECMAKGCCYEHYQYAKTVPWCFHPHEKQGNYSLWRTTLKEMWLVWRNACSVKANRHKLVCRYAHILCIIIVNVYCSIFWEYSASLLTFSEGRTVASLLELSRNKSTAISYFCTILNYK